MRRRRRITRGYGGARFSRRRSFSRGSRRSFSRGRRRGRSRYNVMSRGGIRL